MIKNRLAELMGIKRLERADIARMTGLQSKTIKKIFNNETKGIDFDTLDKLCWALECNTQELFRYIPDDLVK